MVVNGASVDSVEQQNALGPNYHNKLLLNHRDSVEFHAAVHSLLNSAMADIPTCL